MLRMDGLKWKMTREAVSRCLSSERSHSCQKPLQSSSAQRIEVELPVQA